MFDSNENAPSNLRSLEQSFSNTTRKLARLSLTQHRKSQKLELPPLRHLLEDYRHHPKNLLIEHIHTTNNITDLLKLLFLMTDDIGWREWSSLIELLLQRVHNNIVETKGLYHLAKTPALQQGLEKVCCLKHKGIQGHVILLMEIIVGYNKTEMLIDQRLMSAAMLGLMSEDNSRLFWTLALMDVSFECVMKCLSRNLFAANEIQFCTMLASFIVDSSEDQTLKVFNHSAFEQLMAGIFNCTNSQLKREAHLVLNNFMSKSARCFRKAVQNMNLVKTLLEQDSEETWHTLRILLCASKQWNESYIDVNGCLQISSRLSSTNSEIISSFLF